MFKIGDRVYLKNNTGEVENLGEVACIYDFDSRCLVGFKKGSPSVHSKESYTTKRHAHSDTLNELKKIKYSYYGFYYKNSLKLARINNTKLARLLNPDWEEKGRWLVP